MVLKNGIEIIIRKTVKEDAQNLLDYLKIVGGESDNLTFDKNGLGLTVEQEEHYIENINSSRASAQFIGTIGHNIVCCGGVTAQSRDRTAHQSNLGISVLKEFWDIGVGTGLMEKMIEFAKETGKTEIIHLGVRADNDRAIALYKKLGFQEIGRYPKYFKIRGEYYDDILMNLYL